MGLVAIAAAQGLGAGNPRAMKKLTVQFRGMGLPEQEIVVTGIVRESSDGVALVDCEAAQGNSRIIRNAEAEIAL